MGRAGGSVLTRAGGVLAGLVARGKKLPDVIPGRLRKKGLPYPAIGRTGQGGGN
jgi:hypothetical protein